MKKNISILACLLFFVFSGQAQTLFTVSGTIKDSANGELLVSAVVKATNAKAVMSDLDGNYSIQLPEGENTLIVEMPSYKKFTKKITVTGNMTINVVLSAEANELETVVISVGKFEQRLEEVTVSMDVIKPALLENKNTTNCETIMEQVPGVTVQDGQVSMRGGSGFAYGAGSRVLLMVDDMPMLSGDAGDIKWNALPVENIEQIEVMKGASSVLYGSGALNGVIHVRTAYPREKPMTKINVTAGMYGDPARDSLRWWNKGDNPGFTGVYFLHSRQIKKQLDLVAGGAWFGDGGYRQGEEEYRMRANIGLRYRFKKCKNLNVGLNGNFSRAKGGLFVIWQDQDSVYSPSGGANPDSAGSTLGKYNNDRYNIDPFLTYYTKKGNKHALRTRLFNTTNRNSTDTVNQNSNSNIYYYDYQFTYAFKEWHLVSGTSGFYNSIRSPLYGDHDGSNLAAYTQVDKKFFKKLNVSAGIRLEYYVLDGEQNVSTYQRVKNGDTSTLPFQPVVRLGMNYQLTKSTFVRGSFGQGYRFPSVAEKYVTTSVGSLKLFSNPDLKPEYGWSSELGVKQVVKIGNWKGYFDVAGFYTRYDNMTEFTWGLYIPEGIQPTFNPGQEGYILNWVGFRAQNAEKAEISGVEVELAGTGKIGQLEVSTLIGYTYMNPITRNTDSAYRASFSDTLTNILKYRFKHLFKADIQVDYKWLSVGGSVRYNSYMVNVDKTFYNLQVPIIGTNQYLNLGDLLLKGYPSYRARFNKGNTVVDARLMVKLSETTKLGIIVNNVLNAEVMGRPGDVQAPRNVAMQVNIKF